MWNSILDSFFILYAFTPILLHQILVKLLDSFFILYAFTPILLHQILVKRYIVNLYYNPETQVLFVAVHFY
ncbi:unnamed protein product [Gongylonema pulchrum]|uniref:Uncharacterized protein n=1 Tax=Gongylonema pulchrum TaxID=637853 RepID=A0A183EX39_9BILA|nr:unnamed protein product [Gongylonema pulchrum]